MKKKKSMHGSRKWEIPLENSNVLKVHSKITKKKMPNSPPENKIILGPFSPKKNFLDPRMDEFKQVNYWP